MRRTCTVLAILVAVLLASAFPAAAVGVDVVDLIADAEDYSGLEVEVTGELIGDYAGRNGYVWSQLNGDVYATAPLLETDILAGSNIGVGVRLPEAQMAGLDPPGGYRRRGPLVRLTGTWRFHDPDHGGESYLDVTAVEMLEPGRRLDDAASLPVFIVGTLLIVLGGAMALRTSEPGRFGFRRAPAGEAPPPENPAR